MDSRTERGFALYVDMDLTPSGYDGDRFTVQESSHATEHRVWVGLNNNRAHLTVEEAVRVRDGLTEFIASVAGDDDEVVPVSTSVLSELVAAIEGLHTTHATTDVHGTSHVAGRAFTQHCGWTCNIVGAHAGEKARFDVALRVARQALGLSE